MPSVFDWLELCVTSPKAELTADLPQRKSSRLSFRDACPAKLLASFAAKCFAALRFGASHGFVSIQPGLVPKRLTSER